LEANRSEPIEHARDETTTVQSKSNHTEITQVVRPNLDGQIEPLMTRPLRRMQGDSSPAPEQVINVTIGRIEVRATAPPPAQARSANQKPPVMSLDEYLQRRAGGGRGGGV
jgi:erythromycin esterase-like protein